MKIFFLLMTMLAVAIFGLPEATAQCSNGWAEFQGNCYRYYPDKVTWQVAQCSCLAEEANLASIHSEDENSFAYDLINPTDGDMLTWIGLNDLCTENTFVWSDGTAFDYDNWAPNQPDNDYYEQGPEDCVHLWHKTEAGMMNDLPCHHEHAYICKKSA